jgi:Holliday junction resolvase
VYEMSHRIHYEHEARSILEAEGFAVLRSAGSRGPVDLFAFTTETVWMIQVKSTKRLLHRATMTMLRDAALDLLGMPCPPGARRWLFVKELRGGWFRHCVDGWPSDKAALTPCVWSIMRQWAAPDVQEL